MELLAELAARFPKADGDSEKPRLRLLAEDLSETMTPSELTAAIREGKKTWHYLPTLAEIIEAGAEYRDSRRIDRQVYTHHATPLSLPPPPRDIDNSAILAELSAKVDASTAALRKGGDQPPSEPLSWRILRESGRNISPAMEALRRAMQETA